VSAAKPAPSAPTPIAGRRPTEESNLAMIQAALQQQGKMLGEVISAMQAITARLDGVIARLDALEP
jgi:hypothetical protein